MKKQSPIFSAVFFCLIFLLSGCGKKEVQHVREYAGSSSCRECHEKFYGLWSTSHHAKALQPWSAELASMLPEQPEPIEAEGLSYMAHITPERGWITDSEGKEYDIQYALGGKNYYNFLALMDDGRLQVLPIFYDVQHASWRNTTLSMLRHFADGETTDTPVSWRDPMLTFNAECFRCHVSQSESNYDPETDTYATTWKEAGISCEACHGPCSEHIRVFKEAPEGTVPENMELIRWHDMTVKQQNDSCAGCHTKGGAITDSFDTGDDYWDHFDLTTFEHQDYYPNGRDLGENYTMGSWWLSPCATKGNLACTDCHTSSGRYKFNDNPNEACLSCHEKRRTDAAEHMHHPGGGATKCTDCHMAMHSFGGMNQSDHSMRPPMPNLSIAVGSRNACIICHTNQSNEWALEKVRDWHPDFDEHTAPEMRRALLVKALREQDWAQLPAALTYIADPESDPLFATSIIRLLPPSGDPGQHTILRKLTTGAGHPLVRSAAATALNADDIAADRPALFAALSDPSRLVRIRAAERLIALPADDIPAEHRKAFDAAVKEMWTANNLRLDNWGSHFNAANILMRQDRYQEAAEKYDRAHKLRNDIPQPLINGSMAFAQLGNLAEAEDRLLKATQLPEPSDAAQFNLGLLYAEQGRTADAEKALYASLKINPANAQAAYNLAVLQAGKNYPETFRLLNLAIQADPYNPRYPQTLAYYYLQTRQADLAKKVIEQAFERGVSSPDLQALYRQIMTSSAQ